MAQIYRVVAFTDIEGSSRLWEQMGSSFVHHIRNHDDLVRRTVQEFGGEVVKPIGDGFFLAFESARASVAWAVTFLSEIKQYQERTPSAPEFRIRIVLNAGQVETVPDATLPLGIDYFGATVNRAARLSKLGSGEQVLASETVVSGITAEELNALGVELIDLGFHRLKDLTAPEHIIQIHHPSFRVKTFPPLKSLDIRSNNLPSQVTAFFGREKEFQELSNLLKEGKYRLVTLTGFGGIGKSRLAIQLGAELLPLFQNGVFVVWLDRITAPRQIPSTLAESLAFTFYSEENPEEQILRFLEDKNMLLLFDNFEHLLEEDGTDFLIRLLERCPKIRVLVTSRERLNILGELEYPLDALPIPKAVEPVESLLKYPSVRIFEDRAALANPDFSISSETVGPLIQILNSVEGIPIAIELAAGQIRHFPLKEMAESLEQSLEILAVPYRNLPKRQRSLQATIEWSYQLLSQAEKKFLVSLGVFQGGFQPPAARAMSPELSEVQANENLFSLVDRSLVRHQVMDSTARFSLLEPVRQFCLRLASIDSDFAELENRHSKWFAVYAAEESLKLHSPEQNLALSALIMEWPNIQKAFLHSVKAKNWEQVNCFARSLRNFLDIRSLWNEAVYMYQQAYAHLQESGVEITNALQSRALCSVSLSLGRFLLRLGQVEEGTRMVEYGFSLAQHYAESSELSYAYRNLGSLAVLKGDLEEARAHFEKSLQYAEEARDVFASISNLNNLGVIHLRKGEIQQAQQTLEKAFSASQSCGDRYVMATTLSNLGILYQELRERETARQKHEASIEVRKELGDKQGIASCLNNLGLLASEEGNLEEARRLFLQSLEVSKDLGDRNGVMQTLTNLGEILWRLGCIEDAGHYFADAENHSRMIGNPDSLADILNSRGVLEIFFHRPEQARGFLLEALMIARQLGLENRLAESLVGIGLWLEKTGKPGLAYQLITSAVSSGKIGDFLENQWANDAIARLKEILPADASAQLSSELSEAGDLAYSLLKPI